MIRISLKATPQYYILGVKLGVLFAEREGFEPPEALTSTVFKTAAIDHSAISPCYFSENASAKVKLFSERKNSYVTLFFIDFKKINYSSYLCVNYQ